MRTNRSTEVWQEPEQEAATAWNAGGGFSRWAMIRRAEIIAAINELVSVQFKPLNHDAVLDNAQALTLMLCAYAQGLARSELSKEGIEAHAQAVLEFAIKKAVELKSQQN